MNISDEELRLILTVGKVIVFPVVGFIVGFFAKWFLESRKSRAALLRALAPTRATAFQALWQRSSLPENVRRMQDADVVPIDFLKARNEELLNWYYEHANALFLSWRSTKRLFAVFDILRSERPSKERVAEALSSLRTSLKRDCGIYTAFEAWRQLPMPRAER